MELGNENPKIFCKCVFFNTGKTILIQILVYGI